MLRGILISLAACFFSVVLIETAVVKTLAGNGYRQSDLFPSTHWSVIVAAGRSQADPEIAHAALAELCQTYWSPLYSFVRSRGYSVHDVAATAHKTVERRPIGLAKLGERGLRNFRFGLAFPCREDHAPMSRRKQITASMPVACQRLHISGLYQDRRKKASHRNFLDSVQHAFRNPFLKGKQSSFRKPICRKEKQ